MKDLNHKTLFLFTTCFLLMLTNLTAQELWGTTLFGGIDNAGVIYKTDNYGNNIEVIKEFYRKPFLDVKYPMYTKLLHFDEKLYGTSIGGGEEGKGTIFEYDPATNELSIILSFIGDEMGKSPSSRLLEFNGELYGTARMGDGGGSLFKYSFTEGYTKLAPVLAPVNCPVLINGKLYGTSHVGGDHNVGYMYEYDLSNNQMNVVVHFESSMNGDQPWGSLLTHNGKIYGMTLLGGDFNQGVIYEFDPISSICMKIYDFDGVNGAHPYGGLIAVGDKFYGMTTFGGVNESNANMAFGNDFMPGNSGTLFEFDLTTVTLLKLHDFDGVNGAHPQGDLVEYDGRLIGVTAYGGLVLDNHGEQVDQGVIFEYDLSKDPSIAFSKTESFHRTARGKNAFGTLTEWNGMLYGMTRYGGARNHGALFAYNPASQTMIKKLDFQNDWRFGMPNGGLINYDGDYYGMTAHAGDWNAGSIYKIDPITLQFTLLYSFDGVEGQWPWGQLMAYEGMLYGLASRGGIYDNGVLFAFDPETGIFNKKVDFTSEMGHSPSNGSLVEKDGKLYGCAPLGGLYNMGTLFAFDPETGIFNKKVDFDGSNGIGPWHGLTVSGGKLYGLTSGSFSPNNPGPQHGTLFEFDPISENLTTKVDFNGNNGTFPSGNLLLWQDKLYGVAAFGGINDTPEGIGVIFEFDPNFSNSDEALNVLFNFNETEVPGEYGAHPRSSLQELCGRFYGTTSMGGHSDNGTIFKFQTLNHSIEKLLSFDGNNGKDPRAHVIINEETFETPEILSITSELSPVPVDEEIELSVLFNDGGNNIFGAMIDWGDGIQDMLEYPLNPLNITHTYLSPGVYTVIVSIYDGCNFISESYDYIVVYDPSEGFVTGGGWINSPEGAYIADPSLIGKANFGFVSKYKKGQTTPDGNTEFQFKAGELNFHSDIYDWLVIAGPKAMFKGEGTINNDGWYGFQLNAIDEALTPSTDDDLFRIKIWDKNNNDALIYDNKVGEIDPNADPTTEIGGGNIVIHKTQNRSVTSEEVHQKIGMSNYPNPFSESTIIRITLPKETNVLLRVFDMQGKEIRVLANESFTAGNHEIDFNAGKLIPGIYLYSITTETSTLIRKLNVLK